MTKVAHLTSVHSRTDMRIFSKMCRSLVGSGYEVFLVVADGLGDEEKNGVRILDTGAPRNRLRRIYSTTRQVFRRAVAIDADIYHIHDPELMIFGMALRRRGKRVIFDSHEDLPKQIMSKNYIPAALRRPVSSVIARVERYVCGSFDIVVAATPAIRDKFVSHGIPAIDIKNYPLEAEIRNISEMTKGQLEVCYVGGISMHRGIFELVGAMDLVGPNIRLNLVGVFSEASLRDRVTKMGGWHRVNEHGFQDRRGVDMVFRQSLAGLVTLHPTPAYKESLPVKMFEYMSAGLPVVASNFPLWREIIEGHDCGICVDPLDPAAIAAAIDRLADSPEWAREKGKNGRRAVLERYNWAVEERKLFALYEKLSPGA